MKNVMPKFIFIAMLAMFVQSNYAQVGIGTTTPNADAILDVTSTNAGLLLPRIALTATTSPAPLTADVAGMTVYNTATAGDVTPGFYYNDGTDWIRLGGGATSGWGLTGNAGTTPATNFLGTTDAQDLVLRSNNIERVRVASDGKVGVNENNPSNATLEVGGNLIVGNTYTGGTAVAQAGGMTVEGRVIVGDDDFYYGIDKLVIYGNTNWIATSATNGDNGNGLTYAINGYTSNGVAVYGEDNDGGVGVESNVQGAAAIGVWGYDTSGTGTGVIGISSDNPVTTGWIGVHGVETSITNFAILAQGDFGYTAGIVNLSDRRLKKNIKPISGALSILDKVNPTYYDMKWEEYKTLGLARTPQMGFIAQELEQVLPHLVSEKNIPLNNNLYTKKELEKNPALAKIESKSMEVKMVNYVQMVPLLTQAIKEQQAIIEKLTARIEKLEK